MGLIFLFPKLRNYLINVENAVGYKPNSGESDATQGGGETLLVTNQTVAKK
jgi:hypothetical protein